MAVKFRSIAFLLLAISNALAAQSIPQSTSASTAATRDTSYIDSQGTAYVTRVVPVPPDLSPETRKSLIRTTPDQGPPEPLAARRARMEVSATRQNDTWSKLCPNTIAESTIAGVPVRIVTPSSLSASNRDKVLINLHGGSFNADSGSFAESIPIAGYTGIKVIAVLYRLAPEHPFPAAVDDAVAVYRELLKTYKPGARAVTKIPSQNTANGLGIRLRLDAVLAELFKLVTQFKAWATAPNERQLQRRSPGKPTSQSHERRSSRDCDVVETPDTTVG